ncbi:uncharacterized protein LOC116017589 isoform X1 [Ipomoea triloba]|uniref:uncharacterized protein LOC116017589 isoform X1 n=2 Tax=Ipomoea triloba TaxID=35885 RepID=UPI00125E7E46|nr:uncharacterized protein LOC116017589 isoform X1 [Ipomoea triloba]
MEVELEPRVKPLPFKVKAMSRESPAQKASHVLDPDLRNHWSTGTNTKEWILLELDEPCLLSHIRIYNKSVLEWEISVGLRYKPETFAKARPRCEAPRRDMMYPMNYTPCRYIRISCLRGSPIAIFFIQLIGISVTGLEPEFQPAVDYLLPHIVSHRQDTSDLHLQLLQDITTRLAPFLPQLEADLNGFSEAAEPGIRFLAMLVGQFYPILHLVKEREATRLAGNTSESETSRNNQMPTALTVSSNFEPRRSRNASSLILPTSSYLVFRPDAIFMLLRKAHKDYNLGNVCRVASQILLKFMEPSSLKDASQSLDSRSSLPDEGKKLDTLYPASFIDYSDIFGEEFRSPEHHWDSKVINVLDIALVEEGVLHVLYACASQPLLCSKFADNSSNFWSALPLVQALLPALRPNVNIADQIDDSFSQWKLPFVQQALSQIVGTSSSSLYRPLLHACAGYLSSFSPTHAKASCVLIDMCSGVLAPWMTQVIAKMDLTVELLEDLLAVIQGARHSFAQARAALKYIVLALSGHMDEVLSKYKDAKHRLLFLIEMLEPYLDPAITPLQSTISFGNISSVFLEKQEHNCALALNVIRTAVRMPALLPSLEAEWRRGSVSPSVLLSVLEPHIQLPPDVNLRQFSVSCLPGSESSISPDSTAICNGGVASTPIVQDSTDGKTDVDMSSKMDLPDEVSLLFAPPEINRMSLITASGSPKKMSLDSSRSSAKTKANPTEKDLLNAVPGASKTVECHYLQADYLQLVNHQECQLRSSEFRRLALDLHSQNEVNPESHDAAIDALLLAAECYVNPYFMMSFKDTPKVTSKMKSGRASRNCGFGDLEIGFEVNENDLKTLIYLERKRDKIVLEIMLQAAELDRGYQQNCDGELPIPSAEENEVIKLSEQDTQTADAVTLLRQNQALLCNFVIQRLQRDNYLQHEVLLQTLLFLLHSGTKLFCAPADIIEIILRSAEHLNRQLTSFYYQLKEGSSQLEEWKLQLVQRLWMLLQRLVVASSGSAEGLELSINVKSRFQFANLIPPSAWLEKIPTFSTSVSPLARFLGWMAISRNAIQYQKDRLFLVSDIEQLTYLLHVFSDELAAVDNISECKDEVQKTEESGLKQDFGPSGTHHSFHIMYPDISHFFPTLKKQFETLGESILQAVALQLRSLPATTVPDLICWFSEFCSQPFIQNPKDQLSSQNNIDSVKGFVAKNAKAIVLYVLEAIVTEHMEAIVPEVPRVVQVLVSLCRSSYCDVSFLNSVMLLLKPIISYSLQKASAEERLVTDSMCLSFESLCFDELFGIIKSENESNSSVRGHCRALMVFVLASVFPDISSHCKIELLNSSITSADFASFEQTTFFHDYLCAYQALMESCKVLIVDLLRFWGVIPCKISQFSNMDMAATNGDGSEFPCFLEDMYPNSIEPNGSYKNDNDVNKKCQLKIKEIESFSKNLDTLVSKLSQNVEQCYRIHRKLAKNLTQVCAECFLYLRCLSSIVEKVSVSGVTDEQSLPKSISLNEYSDHWKVGLEGLAEMVILLQEHHCWEVASMMLDCLFHVPQIFNLHDVIDKICSAIKTFSHGAPIIAWRLQTDKWMSSLFARGINCLQESEALNDLLHSMLCHPEPEQRFIALKQFGELVSQDGSGGSVVLLPTLLDKVSSERASSVSESVVLSALVSSTWDQVALLASSDTSLPLRINAMALLVNYVPLVERPKLQSFLAAADCVLWCLTKLSQSMCEGPLTQLSIALFACICLYSPAEDISLIPENLWRSIESFSVAGNEKIPMGPEKTVCQALCRLRKEGDEAKKVLKEAISSSSPKQVDPGFASTRETILEVITNLTSVQSYLEFFSKESDRKVLELEEAEIEMELLQKEKALQELSNDFKDQHQLPLLSGYAKNDDRLQQIRDGIKSMEKARLREQIVARRQKKLLTRRARQTYLEEAAIREAQLLQELDRERTAEVEREIERQRLLELERAKTRELRHNLDLEKEKQTQRELQRELEQVESGLRPSRREFSSTHTSRPRERYRERENGRAVNEGTLKASTGTGQPETVSTSSSTAAMPTVMLSGARQFSSQLPTILQSRDRSDEGGNSYDDNFDGSRDSGDTGSIGDADIASALDGVSMNFGPSQKLGSRGGGKSRQIMERRDRDGRREGKWERKH